MNTRTGKIARLPKTIREELNRRLENGEFTKNIAAWLNQLPEVQKLIAEQFGGHPIRQQNISQWRQGGYIDWIRHQLLREQTRLAAEQSAELGLDTSGNSISIAEDIATIMSAELAIHVHALGEMKNPKQRFRQFRHLSHELSRFRRDDQRALRIQLNYGSPLHLASQHTAPAATPASSLPAAQPSSTLDPRPSTLAPSVGGASSLSAIALCEGGSPASRAEPATSAGETTEPATTADASAQRASIPDCGSPLPLSTDNSIEPEPPASSPAKNQPPAPSQSSTLDPRPSAFPPPHPPIPTKTYHEIFSAPIRARRLRWLEG